MDRGATDFKQILTQIVSEPTRHARWLNTLSLMENTGARKIARYQEFQTVSIEVLKHAAEESRHAYYLKAQIPKTGQATPLGFLKEDTIGGRSSRRYLDLLETKISRYLADLGWKGTELKNAAYILITTAIEVRAQSIYPVYEEVLGTQGIPISLKMILAEESEHLSEMESLAEDCLGASWRQHANVACDFENVLFDRWAKSLESDLQVS